LALIKEDTKSKNLTFYKMTKKLIAVVALMALALAGCASTTEESTMEEATEMEVSQPNGEVEIQVEETTEEAPMEEATEEVAE